MWTTWRSSRISLVMIGAISAYTLSQQLPLRALTPEMRIVSSDSIPHTQLTSASDVLVAADGFIFVMEPTAQIGCVRVYDPNGKFVRSFGRHGQGPSELSPNMEILIAAGDSVLIHERGRDRIQVFRRTGTFVRTINLVVNPASAFRGYLSAGRTLTEIGYRRSRNAADSSAYVVIDSTSREIARIAVQKTIPDRLGVRGVVGFVQPFVPTVQWAQDPNGYRAVAAIPRSFWGGQPGQVKLVLLDRTGIQSQRIVNVGAERATPALRDAWIRKALDPFAARLEARGITRAAAEREVRDGFVSGEFIREIEDVLLGSDGAIWLKRVVPNDWVIVSPAGATVTRVQAPQVRVTQVSIDRMWGVVYDRDGVPSVVRYSVSRQ